MKLLIALLVISLNVFAHEGGHGSVAEGGKYGGITSPVVDRKEAGKGEKATTLYKAELVRSESGKLSLYVFNPKMELVSLNGFAEEVVAKLEVKKKGKFTYFGDFKMKKNGNHYTGQLPVVEYKPFNIDFFFGKEKTELFVGFSNLD
jgi:hypothetical protein